jgi:hypothetical protein
MALRANSENGSRPNTTGNRVSTADTCLVSSASAINERRSRVRPTPRIAQRNGLTAGCKRCESTIRVEAIVPWRVGIPSP